MRGANRFDRAGWAAILGAVSALVAFAPGAASGEDRWGHVLPARATPHGYSLSEMASITADFNVTLPRSNPPDVPFQILYIVNPWDTANTFRVGPGVMLYVPVMNNDNSLPIVGDFPPAGDRRALLHYFYGQSELGVVFADVVVDGRPTTLSHDYVVEVRADPPLPDGATLYQTVAAFLSPLPPGTHSVEIRARGTGAALSRADVAPYFPGGFFEFSATYTVIVADDE